MERHKTWGTNKLIQEIRTKIRYLRKEQQHRFEGSQTEYGEGYIAAMNDALNAIRQVMHNEHESKRRDRMFKKSTAYWDGACDIIGIKRLTKAQWKKGILNLKKVKPLWPL